MTALFISYRRSDSASTAEQLYHRLQPKFDTVFKDTYSIGPGRDFRGEIISAISRSDIVLVLIGSTWLTVTDGSGKRRIDDPHDWVYQEVAISLQQNKQVIPVVLHGASMPAADALPVELRQLAFKNAYFLTADFNASVLDLIYKLSKKETPSLETLQAQREHLTKQIKAHQTKLYQVRASLKGELTVQSRVDETQYRTRVAVGLIGVVAIGLTVTISINIWVGLACIGVLAGALVFYARRYEIDSESDNEEVRQHERAIKQLQRKIQQIDDEIDKKRGT